APGGFLRMFGSGRIDGMRASPEGEGYKISPRAAQFLLGEVEPVVAPEAALSDEERGYAEDPAGQRQVGVLAQGVLHFLRIGGRDQRFSLEPHGVERPLDNLGVRDVLTLHPVGG